MIILFLNIAKIPKKYSKKVYIINFFKKYCIIGPCKNCNLLCSSIVFVIRFEIGPTPTNMIKIISM